MIKIIKKTQYHFHKTTSIHLYFVIVVYIATKRLFLNRFIIHADVKSALKN